MGVHFCTPPVAGLLRLYDLPVSFIVVSEFHGFKWDQRAKLCRAKKLFGALER